MLLSQLIISRTKPGGTIELPGVEDIVPDAVEAADDGGFWCHERIGHPDGEDGVLLTEGLTGRDLTDLLATKYHGIESGLRHRLTTFSQSGLLSAGSVLIADISAQCELQNAADK